LKVCWLFVLAVVSACGAPAADLTGPGCGDVGVPAITLVALDARTRQPITRSARVIARDGEYADTAGPVGMPPVYGIAYNRPGTYSVTLDLAGYLSWRIDGVVAHPDRCNVVTVPLTAWLVPSAPATVLPNVR